MIEYVNLLLLLTMFGSTSYVYYKLKKFFYIISIVMDSEILDQLTDLGRDVDSEFPKPKRGRKKKADTKMNELEDNDVRDKRERLVACVLSGKSKMYLGKEYTEQQINEMDYNSINTLLNRYKSVLSSQMTKSLGKSVINLYSNFACSVLGVGNQQDLKGTSSRKQSLAEMKEREKCKKMSHHRPQCAKWFSRYSISKLGIWARWTSPFYRFSASFSIKYDVTDATLQDNEKMKAKYLRSLLFDLFETLQAVRTWQRNFASFQILLLWQPLSKLLSIIEKTKGLLLKQK